MYKTFKHSDGIITYTVESILQMKCEAYTGRYKLRDLFDIVTIYKLYTNLLTDSLISRLLEIFDRNGIERVDYFLETTEDEFIDKKVLEERFLEMYHELGLL